MYSDVLLFYFGGVLVQIGYCIHQRWHLKNKEEGQYAHLDDLKAFSKKQPVTLFLILFYLLPLWGGVYLLYPDDPVLFLCCLFAMLWICCAALFGLAQGKVFLRIIAVQWLACVATMLITLYTEQSHWVVTDNFLLLIVFYPIVYLQISLGVLYDSLHLEPVMLLTAVVFPAVTLIPYYLCRWLSKRLQKHSQISD